MTSEKEIDKMTGTEIAKYLVQGYSNLPTLMIDGKGFLLTYCNGKTGEVEQFEYKKLDKALKDFKVIEQKYRNHLKTGWWD